MWQLLVEKLQDFVQMDVVTCRASSPLRTMGCLWSCGSFKLVYLNFCTYIHVIIFDDQDGSKTI